MGHSGNRRHLCIDMQRMFAEATPWQVTWMGMISPAVIELAGRHKERTIFTRFIPPDNPQQVHGTWRAYYRKWQDMTRERLPPNMISLTRPLPEAMQQSQHKSVAQAASYYNNSERKLGRAARLVI
jgi:nicotinamidase-related amidase